MSQHDLDVANQSGALFRADLNLALQAQATNQSGSGEPSPTFPCQWWADTSTGLLKQRNTANTAWVVSGLLSAENLGLAPIGMGAVFYMNTPPAGWLKSNGAAVSRATYSQLFGKISTTYGAGDGSTTFNLPDDRGEFWRGWDDGRGIDTGRVFGSFQADALKSHSHAIKSSATGGGGSAAAVLNSGASPTQATDLTGDVETRPRNRALLKCIKYI